ncbi:hypothetical protein C8F04DRAFT_1192447 [Mycena alexandri]|uniref:Uncharacterized protein n=1 Tax=Mycena alexandri TaxID=1745969 RepID=A0AAD6SCG7_9AGAR|nr:hypothetical protein C8F04DRAFT_1192447 [Mycena alexandri]
MVKNSLPTRIFLMLQGLFCTQWLFVFLLVVPHPMGSDGQERPTGRISLACKDCFYLFNVLTSLCRISGDGQEQPTGSHLPHGARNEHFKPIAIMLSSSGHNMLKPHLPFELLSSATQQLLLFAVDGSVPLQVAEGGNRARSLLPPPAVRQMVV